MTSTTTVFNPLLEENFQKLTVPNFRVFATVAEARTATYDATLADSDCCYITEKEALYNYCTDCGLPDDGDLVIATSSGGDTRWEMLQKVSRTQGDTGWIDRDGLTVTKLNTTTLRATLTSKAYYAVNSKRITLQAGTYDISFTGSARTIAVYFDSAGALAQSNSVPAALFTSTPVAVVYWTGTQIGGIQTEFHGIRDTVWHAWAHKYLGTQYSSGLSITTNTQADSNTDPNDDTVQYLWLTTGVIFDEDTQIDIGTGNWLQTLGSGLTSATAASIPFFYYSAAASAVIGVAANADRYPFLYTGANGYPEWENAGVRTAAVNGDYVVYHYFASPFIDGYSVFARPHNAKFSTLLAAQAARPASLTWSAIGEFKHIYSVVFRCGSWSPIPAHNCKIVSVQDFRLVSSGPASATSASAHGALSGLADAGAHPASAIAPDTTNFGGELSTSETNVQLALDRIDDYDTLLDWATGKTYRVGNVVRVSTALVEGFAAEWRCVTAHTSTTFTADVNSGYWEIVANSEGSRELINAASHGFAAGDVLYHTGSAYAKAKADTAATAEVVGIVTGATTNYFVMAKTGKITKTGWGLTAGAVYFLSDSTDGAITATEPTTVSNISKPVGIATSTTTLQFFNMRGTTVGGTNLYTTIALANNAATTIQNVSGSSFPAGTGGYIEGFLKIDATTDTVVTFKAEWSKPITGTAYKCSVQYGADDLPTGVSIDITTGGLIQVTLPSVSGFSSASATFAMQAAAVGAQLPLQISGSQVTGPVLGSTSGTAIASGYVGEKITWASAPGTYAVTGSEADWNNASIALSAGVWDIKANIQVQVNTAASAGAGQDLTVKITDSSNNIIENQVKLTRTKTSAAVTGDMVCCVSFAFTKAVSSSTTYKIRAVRADTGGGGGANLFNQSGLYSEFYAVRIG